MITRKTKAKKPADKIFKAYMEELEHVINYCAAEDGLPKPKITKDDLESWN